MMELPLSKAFDTLRALLDEDRAAMRSETARPETVELNIESRDALHYLMAVYVHAIDVAKQQVKTLLADGRFLVVDNEVHAIMEALTPGVDAVLRETRDAHNHPLGLACLETRTPDGTLRGRCTHPHLFTADEIEITNRPDGSER